MTRFLHSADWQLGMTRHYLDADAQPRFTRARLDAVAAIGDLAEAEDCPFVVVSGDVFETNHVERRVVVSALDAMGAHPDVTFYLLPGNHDPLDAATVYRSATFTRHRPDNVVVLEDTDPVDTGSGAVVVGAPWLSRRPLTDLVSEATADLPDHGRPCIVVGHGAVDTLSPNPHDPALISQAGLEAALDEGRCQYVALGDRHSTTPIGATGQIWYAGSPEATDYVEDDPGNVLLVEITDGNVAVEPRRVGTWSFLVRHFEVTGRADCDEIQSFLDGIDDKARAIVKLALVGQLSLADKAHLDGVLGHYDDLLGALEAWERHTDLVVLPDDRDFDLLQFKGFAQDAFDELSNRADGTDEEAGTARDALGLLYRLGVADQ